MLNPKWKMENIDDSQCKQNKTAEEEVKRRKPKVFNTRF